MIASKPGASSTVTAGVGSITTLSVSSVIDSASNGCRPSTSSYRITPIAQMSVRASTSRALRSCSGDMYAGEPITVAVLVSEKSSASAALAMPKSSTFTLGEPSARTVRNRFAGLRSRWMMPMAWASAIASAACSMKLTTCATGSRVWALRNESRSWPSRYSITR